MSDAGFEKVSSSDERMYGPRMLLICGFSSNAQPNFVKFLEILGLCLRHPDLRQIRQAEYFQKLNEVRLGIGRKPTD